MSVNDHDLAAFERACARSRERLREAMQAHEEETARALAALRAKLTGVQPTDGGRPRSEIVRERERAAEILDALALRLVKADPTRLRKPIAQTLMGPVLPKAAIWYQQPERPLVSYNALHEAVLSHVEPLRESVAVSSAQTFGSTIKRCRYWSAARGHHSTVYGLVADPALRAEMREAEEKESTKTVAFEW